MKKLTTQGLLAAVALAVFVVEAQIPLLPAVQGIKLGLANVVSLFALYTMGPWSACMILLTRILLGGLITGRGAALLYSLGGGLLSFVLCAVLHRFFSPGHIWIVSIFGALAHNLGQLAMAVWITRTPALVPPYLPVLVIAGLLTGLFTGLACQVLANRLNRLGFIRFYGKWTDMPDG